MADHMTIKNSIHTGGVCSISFLLLSFAWKKKIQVRMSVKCDGKLEKTQRKIFNKLNTSSIVKSFTFLHPSFPTFWVLIGVGSCLGFWHWTMIQVSYSDICLWLWTPFFVSSLNWSSDLNQKNHAQHMINHHIFFMHNCSIFVSFNHILPLLNLSTNSYLSKRPDFGDSFLSNRILISTGMV